MRSGLIMACFKMEGTWPVWREWFITEVIRGLRTVIWVFTREGGRGSRAQVMGFIFLMKFCTSSEETRGKELRVGGMQMLGERFG